MDDLLVIATRAYLNDRARASRTATLARALGWVLVVERGVLARARAAGLRIKAQAAAMPRHLPVERLLAGPGAN